MATEEQLFIKIDEELKRKFVVKLAEKKHTQKRVINDAIKNYLESEGAPEWLNDKG